MGCLKLDYYDETGISGMRIGSTEYYFRKNVFGDVIELYYGSNGAFVGRYEYDAWGKHTIINFDGSIISQSGIHSSAHPMLANPFRYRGYYYDRDTEFYYLQSRYYDPQIGRFLSPDKPENLLINGMVPGGANLYAYCLNNPIKYTDPSGEFIPFILAVVLLVVCVAIPVAAATAYVAYKGAEYLVNEYDLHGVDIRMGARDLPWKPWYNAVAKGGLYAFSYLVDAIRWFGGGDKDKDSKAQESNASAHPLNNTSAAKWLNINTIIESKAKVNIRGFNRNIHLLY